MAFLQLNHVNKFYDGLHAIKDVDLKINQGEFIVFVGPSGCGKSTLLRMIAGLEEINQGELRLDGRNITAVPPAKRDLAMVFQSYALYPHMTVEQNMSFALRLAKVDPQTINSKVADAARKLGLTPYLQRTPKALSGGQRQRVAIGRAIVRAPKVFLFDEPLSNLDAALRSQTRLEIARLHRELGATTIYVTHDQVEAMTLADRVVVLNHGVIEQVGTPLQLYDQPANKFVAQFIGTPKMNILNARDISVLTAEWFVDAKAAIASIGLRPEHIDMFKLDAISEESYALTGTVDLIESLGSETLLHVSLASINAPPMVIRRYGRIDFQPGEQVGIRWHSQHVHCFDDRDQSLVKPKSSSA